MSRKRKRATDLDKRLLELAYDLSLAGDFRGALSVLLGRLCDLMPCDGVSVMWLDSDHLEVIGSRGTTAPLRGLTLPVGQVGAARSALDSGRPVAVSDTEDDPRWQPVPGEEQVRTWLGVPLAVDGWTIGLLEWTAREPDCFDEEDLALASEIGRCVAPILRRSQLLDDARQRLRESIDSQLPAVPQVTDLGAELQPVVHEALEFTAARDAFVFLEEEGVQELHCVAAAGDSRERVADLVLRGDETLGGWSVPMARSSGRSGPGPSDREVFAELGIEHTLILPLRAGGEQVGVLGIAGPQRRRAFSRDAIQLMTHLASQASMIVERIYRQTPSATGRDYEAVFQSSPLGVGVLSVAGELRLCNPALASLLSRSDKSLVGRILPEFLVPSDGQRLLRALEEVTITGQRRQVDARVRSATGEHRHVRISLSLAHISDAAGGNLVAIMEDITSLKILERERVEHLRQLRAKHAQLEELDQLKSRFVSNVSHELRTPLAVIKLYATLARKGRPEKQVHYLQTIEQETHRLETMVENILDLNRMDRRALRLTPELLSAEEVIAQVLQVYEETAQKQAIEMLNHVRGQLPPLWADRNHLIQILTNLVDNALKYTPRGGQVWVSARDIGSDADWVLEIAVGDTGVGIPEDEQEQVFERFYRGSNNTPGSTGTGLGLSIVRELMLQHGGEVTVKSRPNDGTVFTLEFPLYDGGIPADVQDNEEHDD